MSNNDKEALPSFAREWMAQRQIGFARLDQMRLEQLRQLTESDAARMFSKLAPAKIELRESSGLVEQQRVFMRYWDNREDVES